MVRLEGEEEPRPQGPHDGGALPSRALLGRIEEQADALARVRVRNQELKAEVDSLREQRGALEASLQEASGRNAALERKAERLVAQLERAAETEGGMDRMQQVVAGLQEELRTTRMQLEAVRAELTTSRMPLSRRLHRRSWR